MRIGYVCCLLPGVIAATAASAAASSSPAFGKGESLQTLILAPYLWAPNISGSIGLAGLRVPLQLSSNLLFKGVNTGGMGYARWQRGDRFAYAEGIFISFGEKSFAPFFGESVDSKLRFGEVGGGVVRRRSLGARGAMTFSPYAGLRYTRLTVDVAGVLLTTGSKNQWLDPAAGLLLNFPLAGRFDLISKLDAAGFGISSNEYYSALAVVNCRFGGHLQVAAGYRWTKAHYRSSGGVNFDLDGRGPLLGLQYSI